MSWSCFSMFPSCSLDLGVQLGRYGSYDYAMTQPLLYPHALASSSPWVAACQASFPLRVYQQVAGRMSFKLPTLWGEDGHRVVNKNEHHWRGNMVGIQQFFLCGCLIFDDNWHRRGLAGRGGSRLPFLGDFGRVNFACEFTPEIEPLDVPSGPSVTVSNNLGGAKRLMM